MFQAIKKSFNKIFTKSLESISGIVPFHIADYKINWSQQDYTNAYYTSIYAHKCIEKRAEKVGEINFKVMQNDREVEDDPIMQLLNNPNPIQSAREFWELYQKYYDIVGEVYIVLDGDTDIQRNKRINAMYHLPPHKVTPTFDTSTGELLHVRHDHAEGHDIYDGENVIYDKRPDPMNQLRGMSLLKAGIRAIQTNVQIDEYQANVLQNGGRVEGVFKINDSVTNQQQLEKLKDSYIERHAEASKAGRPLFLPGNVDYQNIGLSPSELSYLETKDVTFKDILILTSVPKVLVASFEDVKYENAEQARRMFSRDVVKPLMERISEKLRSTIMPKDRELMVVDPTPEDIDEKTKKAESGIKNYYMTINEARELMGLEAMENGDEILRPMNLVEQTGSTPTPAPTEERSVSKDFQHPLRDYDMRRYYEQIVMKRFDKNEKKLSTAIDNYFEKQKQRITAQLASDKQKDLTQEVFNKEREIQIAVEEFTPLLEEMLKEAGQNTSEISGSDFDFHMSGDVKSFLDKKVNTFSKQINDTTFNELKGQFDESFAQGETREELVDRIDNTYADIKRNRAETIARTEVQGITQFGAFEGYKQSGVPVKIWVTVGDAKVRGSHMRVDGEEVPIKEPFSNGLMHPGDPNGNAYQVVNCRCSI